MEAQLKLDPTGYYEANLGDDWREKCVEVMGVLPEFMFGPHATIAENMEKNYQFFFAWATGMGAKVSNECFCFPGDPPQYPIMSATHGNETVYIYQHALVAQTVDGELTKWTRMD